MTYNVFGGTVNPALLLVRAWHDLEVHFHATFVAACDAYNSVILHYITLCCGFNTTSCSNSGQVV